jgi:hypothetical protein
VRFVSRAFWKRNQQDFGKLMTKSFSIVDRVMPKNSNKKWTPEDDKRLNEMVASGKHHALIGAALGRSGGSIAGRLSILNSRVRLKRERATDVVPETPVEE